MNKELKRKAEFYKEKLLSGIAKAREFLKKYKFKNIPLLSKWKKIPYGFKIIGAVVAAGLIVLVILLSRSCSGKNPDAENAAVAAAEYQDRQSAEEYDAEGNTKETGKTEYVKRPEEQEAEAREQEITMMIASYGNIGIIKCETHLFMREEPNTRSARIGKLYAGAACSVIGQDPDYEGEYDPEEWIHITSGGITGYVKSEYLYTGDEAKQQARENIKERAIAIDDEINIRQEPSAESESLGKVYQGERYLVRGIEGDWIKIDHDGITGYIYSKYAEIQECLNEARRLVNERDKETALNLYTNLGMTNFESGLRNVRTGPGTDYRIIGMLTPDCAVDILGEDGEWLKIRSGPVEGYIKADFISTGTSAMEIATPLIQLMAISTEDGVNVRSGPGTEYDVITSITNAERYPVISQTWNNDYTEEWVQIDLGDTDDDGESMSAYIRRDLVDVRYAVTEAFMYSEDEIQAANSDSRRASIVSYALKFVGGRYVWGGTSLTNGCDCSGFVQSVLKNFGISVPRTSREQSKVGRKITSSELRPGDLIFYANKSGTINHVTMYIGGGRVVGAQSSKSGIKTAAWNYRTPVKIVNVMGD